MLRIAVVTGLSALAAAVAVPGAFAAPPAPSQAEVLRLVLRQIPADYASADRTHDAAVATRLRETVRVAHEAAARLSMPGAAAGLARLQRLLAVTTVRLRPWPFVAQVRAAAASASNDLPASRARSETADDFGPVGAELDRLEAELAGGRVRAAGLDALGAAALFRVGAQKRLQERDPALAAQILVDLEGLEPRIARGASVDQALSAARDDLRLGAQTLGESTVSRETIVGDAAVIVFREGLEAVLILAALTASFTGARRRLRRPVMLGALAGLGATAVTWVIAQTTLHSLSTNGLELQAITGLLAIGVLLIVTNWFFHRIYWSEWIGRFNRRRKALEGLDRGGFLSGQILGFVLLGLTSVYREGFETVVFLQSLQLSAGTATTMAGVALGLAATLAVGAITFLVRWKLPYKRMLIVTGVLIAFVLAVMVGTTAHTMQGIGWLSISRTPFGTPFWTSTWLGLYPTWETIAAQLGSLVFVIGSYVVARELQRGRRRRATSRLAPLGRRA